MTEFVVGTCLSMCPDKEKWMREREGLLHVLEIDEKTRHLKKPKADPDRIVKCFSRPAAGQIMPDATELRPAPVLLATVRYLFTRVVTRNDYDWAMIYDFVFDRLRAVRQEIIIQRIRGIESIKILEPIVRFHIYAGQRLCEKNISVFDPKINSQHLLECLKQLLVLYDQVEEESKILSANVESNMERLSICGTRSQIEAVYVLLHIGDTSALGRGLSLPEKYRNEDVILAMKISLAWLLRNYVRTFRLVQKLPLLLIFAVLSNLKFLRRDTLRIMSSAYNSKILTFPGMKLQEILMYRDIEKLSADCKLFNLSFANENVQFQAIKFNKDIQLANSDAYFNPRDFRQLLPSILLRNDDVMSK